MTATLAAPEPCDLLVRARAALVLDAEGTVLSDVALAITGNRITHIGPAAETARLFAPRQTVGSPHHLLMPGLVNTHNHTPLMVVRGMVEDVGFAPAYTPGIPQGDMLSEEEAFLLARLGAYEMLRFGSTTVVDFYRHPMALAAAAHEIGLRSFIGGRIMDADTSALARREWRADRDQGERTLREAMDFVAVWSGRSELISPILGPHAPDTCSPGLLRHVAEVAEVGQMILNTHLHQSPMEVEIVQARDGKRPVELMDEVGLLGPPPHRRALHPHDRERHGAVRVTRRGRRPCTGGQCGPRLGGQHAGAGARRSTHQPLHRHQVGRHVRGHAHGDCRHPHSRRGFHRLLPRCAALGHPQWRRGARARRRDRRAESGARADLVLLDTRAPNLARSSTGRGSWFTAPPAAMWTRWWWMARFCWKAAAPPASTATRWSPPPRRWRAACGNGPDGRRASAHKRPRAIRRAGACPHAARRMGPVPAPVVSMALAISERSSAVSSSVAASSQPST